MSNNSDFDKITNPTFQYNAAKEIHKTLLEVFELYPTGR
jgi:N-acetylmuramoyl-L-alanine amidase